ncbi:hypothetical protein OKA06_19170 [Novosphingobium sp. MW5]|nr:hypothetical protein [Novosphingobium sp. MW5]
MTGRSTEDGPVLVVTLNPVDSLALALSFEPKTRHRPVRTGWPRARDLAARLRKARRRLTLIDLSSLAQPEATALWSEIAHRWRSWRPRCGTRHRSASPCPVRSFAAAAQALLQSDETVTALIDELAACTLAPSTPTDTLNTVASALTQQLARLRRRSGATQATVARQTEADRSDSRTATAEPGQEIGQLKKDSAGQRAAPERDPRGTTTERRRP